MNAERISEWLGSLGEGISVTLGDFALWLLIALLVAALVRLVRRFVVDEVEDVNRRHVLRKWVSYVGFFIVLVVGIGLFVGRFGQMATVIGLLAAGLAIALQDIGKSAAGWVYLSSHAGFGPGARVEVDGVVGEVIDVGILKTTVLEVGNLVRGRQSSGRLATIANSKFLNDNFFINPSYSPFSWHEIPFLLTYESDWRKGAEILEELGRREFEGMEEMTSASFRQLEGRYAFKYGPLTPIVYVRAADSGVELVLRYLVHIRRRRGSADRITRAMLEAVEREPGLDFAYPTTRIYRRNEERLDAVLPALVDLERLPRAADSEAESASAPEPTRDEGPAE